jgi:hypothetical protein
VFATSGRQDGTVKLWFTSTLQQEGSALGTREGTTSRALFTPDGRSLLAVDDAGGGVLWPAGWRPGRSMHAGSPVGT